jgi:hypothetical protein
MGTYLPVCTFLCIVRVVDPGGKPDRTPVGINSAHVARGRVVFCRSSIDSRTETEWPALAPREACKVETRAPAGSASAELVVGLGGKVSESVEYVPALQSVRKVRPKLSCADCSQIMQARAGVQRLLTLASVLSMSTHPR